MTFTIKAPKAISWRLDFADGKFASGQGTPPKSLKHTYTKEGDFKPVLTVQTGANAALRGTTSLLIHLKQLISLTVQPPSGKTPLAVKFSLETSITKPVEWSLDFGDGTPPARGSGDPPASLGHTYKKDGSYKATLAIKPNGLTLLATFAKVTAGGGTPPVLALKATPTSGKTPLKVTFATTVNVPPTIVSWQLLFGDGQSATGSGKPPASVSHTYTKKGTFRATLLVAQQQQYGGVRYTTYADVKPG